ncbi:MAG: methyltransferase [Steroidobacteraceae bacterium]
MDEAQRAAGEQVMELANGYIVARAVHVVAELGLGDALAAGPRSVAELAAAVGADTGYLHRVLRLAASYGIGRETEPGRFGPTPLSDVLRDEGPGSIRAAVLQRSDPIWWQACGELTDTVRNGRWRGGDSRKLYAHFERDPAARARFDRGMANVSRREDAAVAAALDLPAQARVVDLGGGRGGLLAALLLRHPQARGVLFEQPTLLADRASLAVAPLLARCELVPGDFFAGVPAGGDVYVYKRIIHSWPRDESIALLRQVREVLPPAGRVLVVDVVIREGNERQRGKLSDLMLMMLGSEGRERTEPEYRELFEGAGFELARVIETESAVSIMEGRVASAA